MKTEIIRDRTLDWFERMMNSRRFEQLLIAAAVLGGAYVILLALRKIIFG